MPVARVLTLVKEPAARLSPMVDGISLPRQPYDPDAPEISADVPMIIGHRGNRGHVLSSKRTMRSSN